MAPYKTVAVAGGTGGLGLVVTEALVASGKFDTVVLSRSADKEVSGAKVVAVDFSDVESLAGALAGVDAVISAVGAAALYDGQLKLIEASKKAGVKRFFPGEFGVDRLSPVALFGGKAAIREALSGQSELEYTLLVCGFFTDLGLIPWVLLDTTAKTATIFGDGNVKSSWTSRQDVGKYLVEILLNPEPSKNASVKVAGSTKTWNEVIDLIEEAQGAKYERTYVPISEVKAKIDADPNPWGTIVEQLQLTQGEGYAEITEPLDNAAYPNVVPLTLEEYIKTTYGPK